MVGVGVRVGVALGRRVLVGEEVWVAGRLEGINVGEGVKGLGLETTGKTGSGATAQADKSNPSSRNMPRRMKPIFF
jgi:hypothetical protein